jgi:hypothetical protein
MYIAAHNSVKPKAAFVAGHYVAHNSGGGGYKAVFAKQGRFAKQGYN